MILTDNKLSLEFFEIYAVKAIKIFVLFSSTEWD